MQRFSELYWRLDAAPGTTDKIEALRDYFASAPAEDAACALAVLCGARQLRAVSTTQLRTWAAAAAGLPAWLVEESYAHVGDLAETLARILPAPDPHQPPLATSLAEVVRTTVHGLRHVPEARQREIVTAVWRQLGVRERIVWHKLLTGGLRVGVSRSLVARALAAVAGVEPPVMAQRLMGAAVGDGAGFTRLISAEPSAADGRRPYPFQLASAVERPATAELATALGPVADWQAEWKWDGMRAQLVRRGGDGTLWSRGEELLNEAFPEIVTAGESVPCGTVLDGELLAVRAGRLLGFAALSQRSGRRRITSRLLAEIPCIFVAYDLLEVDGADLRSRPLAERRARLETLVPQPFDPAAATDGGSGRLWHSPVVTGGSWEDLAGLRATARARGVEGLMLKRRASHYGVGRTRGDWWKWKIEPLEIDAVLLYAQAGHGRRAGLHSDYTLGLWHEGRLVTVAKAYSGLSDAEIVAVDKIVRATTVEKHGPVRICTPTLVFQLAFEGVSRSTRHKSGLAVRFPRIIRWRQDKAPADAGTLAELARLISDP